MVGKRSVVITNILVMTIKKEINVKVVFVDKYSKSLSKEMVAIPPIGSEIFMGYLPLCEVDRIILFPNDMLDSIDGSEWDGVRDEDKEKIEVLIYLK